MNTQEFLASPYYRNAWVTEPHMSIYLRKATRVIANKTCKTFDIASLEVEEEYRGKGLFTAWLAGLTLDKFDYIYVENVLKEAFKSKLLRSGFTELCEETSPCFYRKVI